MAGNVKLMTSAGGGVILDTATTTASDVTVKVPTQNCTLGIQGPAFSAYASGTTTLSPNTWTKINYASEEWDTNNNFASSRFTPTVAGYYQINAAFGEGLSANQMSFYIAVFKNGVQYRYMQYVTSTAWYTNVPVDCQVYCNGTTDYIEIYVNVSSAYTNTANAGTNYFQGVLVRAA